MNMQRKSIYFKTIVSIIPAALLGTIGMIFNDIPRMIWLQNLMAVIFGGVITYICISKKIKINDTFIAAISLALLALTFAGNGMEGVHRWIKLSILNINIAMIILPILLVAIHHLFERQKWEFAYPVIAVGAILLLLQPDASQLMGFSIPVIILMFYKKINPIAKYLLSIMLMSFMLLSWIFLDKLAPVSYVEGILGLLYHMSPLWLIAGIISLILIPLPFILFPPRKFRILSVCLGLYYVLIIASAFFGNFPIPIMGYGISPIVGYFIIFTWYVEEKCRP